MFADAPEYLAWRAFYLGLRVAARVHALPPNPDGQADFLRLLGEIADGQTTLHNSPVEGPQMPELAEFRTGLANRSVTADRDLAATILQGFDRATTVPD